jgi:hypothetical protein
MKRKTRLSMVGITTMAVCAASHFAYSRATPVYAATPSSSTPASAINMKALGSGVAQASLSPDGRRIAYQKKTARGWRIYISRLDGSGQKALTSGPKDDVEPSWRSDGALIAFASNRTGNYDLYTVRPDGTGLRPLTRSKTDERYPQWSPRPFGLLRPSDISTHTIAGRSKANVAPGDLKLLEMLAKSGSDWELYKDKFNVKPMARYYKLLFVEGSGDKRQIATMRESGSYRQTLATGMAGAHLNPSWFTWLIIPTPATSTKAKASRISASL